LVLAVVNYGKAVSQGENKINIGNAIAMYWSLNIESAKDYFDRAKDYDHLLKTLVQILLFMVGVAVVLFGGIFFLFFCSLHIVVLIIYWAFAGIRSLFTKIFKSNVR
jgi:hypothetical protein